MHKQHGTVLLPLPALHHICNLCMAWASAVCSVLAVCNWFPPVCIAGRLTLTYITGGFIAVCDVGISCLASAVLAALEPGILQFQPEASFGACRYFQRFRGRKLNFLEIGIQVQDPDVPTRSQPGPICTSQHSPATQPAHSCPVSLTAFHAVRLPPLLSCLATIQCDSICVGAPLQSGGSIGIWQNYFGTGLTMYGMDINPYCKVGGLTHKPMPMSSRADACCSTHTARQPARSSDRRVLEPAASQSATAARKVWHDTGLPPCKGTSPDCASSQPITQELFEDPPRVNIFIADQSDREMWRAFRKQMRRDKIFFDVILDDGALSSPAYVHIGVSSTTSSP